MKNLRNALIALTLAAVIHSLQAANSEPFIGHWALTTPNGQAGWLGISNENNYYDGSILWIGGSVVPVDSVFFHENAMYVTRVRKVNRRNADGDVIRTHNFTEAIVANVNGDDLELVRILGREDGNGITRESFTGTRIPPLPPAPDLSEAKYGATVTLFDGTNLQGWKLTNPNQKNGWSVGDGILINDPAQPEGGRHISYGNLRTEQEFEDFNLTLEVNVGKRGNSGIYLRGIYEVQVSDTYGRPLDSHNMGGIYSRIKPSVNAEKPAGEWQTFDITLLDRHVTVILNGTTIIDNAPLHGCTGGALWSDQFRPGPIYLQGDHTGVKYRSIKLKPILN